MYLEINVPNQYVYSFNELTNGKAFGKQRPTSIPINGSAKFVPIGLLLSISQIISKIALAIQTPSMVCLTDECLIAKIRFKALSCR